MQVSGNSSTIGKVFKGVEREVDNDSRLSRVCFACRTQKELSHRGNEGLDEIVAKLANVKSIISNISFAGSSTQVLERPLSCIKVQHA